MHDDARVHAQEIWAQNRKKLVTLFDDDADKLALAELLALRNMAQSALGAQTMKNLQPPVSRKKLTR